MRIKIASNGKEDINVEKKLKIERHKEAVNLSGFKKIKKIKGALIGPFFYDENILKANI